MCYKADTLHRVTYVLMDTNCMSARLQGSVLQMGALMLATKHVLSPWIKDIRIVEDIIKSQMGDFTSPALRYFEV